MSCNMELLVNKEHCVCCGLQSTDNVATREDAAKAQPADQFEGIFNAEVPGPNRNPDDKSRSVMSQVDGRQLVPNRPVNSMAFHPNH